MKKIIIAIMLIVCILAATITGASASVMIVSNTTAYDDSEAMYNNLDLAIAALNDKVIEKDKAFSFNETVGPRTAEKGYVAAPNGNGVSVMGGGVAQIATTLHMALKNLGEEITYNEHHSFGSAYNAGYVESAADSVLTDYSRKLDYSFTSNHAENLAISMWRSDGMVFCQLTGIGSATQAPGAVTIPEHPSEDETPAVKKMKVVNVNSYVNLRETASTGAKSMAQIPKDAIVEMAGDAEGDFLKVSYNGLTGYVASNYLEEVKEQQPIKLKVIKCKESVSLREEPSKSAKKLADVPLDAEVEYSGVDEGDFRKVIYQEKTGYILKDYLAELK